MWVDGDGDKFISRLVICLFISRISVVDFDIVHLLKTKHTRPHKKTKQLAKTLDTVVQQYCNVLS